MLVLLDLAVPDQHIYEDLTGAVRQVDFAGIVMDGMLAFLLFTGAFGPDLGALRNRAWPVVTLALAGTAILTAVVGLAFWAAMQAIYAVVLFSIIEQGSTLGLGARHILLGEKATLPRQGGPAPDA